MNTRDLQQHFVFSKGQRKGIIVLCAAIILFQIVYRFADFRIDPPDCRGKRQWLALQKVIDSMKETSRSLHFRRYPFNPNFITDFKGYQLGMSENEIDRLLSFRKMNKYVNSAAEFQRVTKVSDSLLASLAPYFKFPEWVKNKDSERFEKREFKSREKTIIDINLASQEDLKKVYGIGDGLSERILKEKEKFGSFVSMKQLNDVWGLSSDVIEKLNESFSVLHPPVVKKIRINDLSVKELGLFPYFRYPISKAIVTYRSMNGPISNADDLVKIPNFPVDKVAIIALYLEF